MKLNKFGLAMSMLMMCNTFIGFGGLQTLNMKSSERQEYYESDYNPVCTMAISDNGDGTYSWFRK